MSTTPIDETRWSRARHPAGTVPPMAFHDLTMTSITGNQVSFDAYRGKMALVVNVASN